MWATLWRLHAPLPTLALVDVAGRTTHVQIHQVRTGDFTKLLSFDEGPGSAAGDLHGQGLLARPIQIGLKPGAFPNSEFGNAEF